MRNFDSPVAIKLRAKRIAKHFRKEIAREPFCVEAYLADIDSTAESIARVWRLNFSHKRAREYLGRLQEIGSPEILTRKQFLERRRRRFALYGRTDDEF